MTRTGSKPHHLMPAAFGASLLLAGCGGTGTGLITQTIPAANEPAANQPVSLTRPKQQAQTKLPPALRTIDEQRAKRSVARFLVNNGGNSATERIAGADLDGDGTAEALVYLQGDHWCASTGCTLLVMREGPTGFDTVSLVKRVKLPVAIAATATRGWRDLMVKSGPVGAVRLVALKFNGAGYPGNASILPPAVATLDALPEIALAPSRTTLQTAGTNSNLIAGQN